MIDKPKVNKFIRCLDHMIEQLEEKNELRVHQQVDQFYYMQKSAEFKTLVERFEDAEARRNKIGVWINECYAHTFIQWKSDMRWMRAFKQIGK